MIIVELPFPPAILSGHATAGHAWKKIAETKKWRAMAKRATEAAGVVQFAATGDIPTHVHFVPPDRRGDRWNYINRCKGIFDGIADALEVNDRRFLPSVSYADPVKPGKVVITIGGV